MQFREIRNRAPQDFPVVDVRAQHNLRVNFNSRVEQLLHFRADVRALRINTQQISAHVQIRRVHRDVLWRETLFDHSRHFVRSNRSQCGVITVKKRQPHILVANE